MRTGGLVFCLTEFWPKYNCNCSFLSKMRRIMHPGNREWKYNREKDYFRCFFGKSRDTFAAQIKQTRVHIGWQRLSNPFKSSPVANHIDIRRWHCSVCTNSAAGLSSRRENGGEVLIRGHIWEQEQWQQWAQRLWFLRTKEQVQRFNLAQRQINAGRKKAKRFRDQ